MSVNFSWKEFFFFWITKRNGDWDWAMIILGISSLIVGWFIGELIL